MTEFLGRLLRHAEGKVLLIVARHPVHRSKKVTPWIASPSGRIERFFLPGYSPELHPDAWLNQDVKTNAHGRRRPRDQPEMISNVRSYLRSTQKQPDVVKRYFDEQNVSYAAESP